MTRAEFQNYFIESFGDDWEFTPRETKATFWDSDMAHRKKSGLPVFQNPWKDAPTPIDKFNEDTVKRKPILIAMSTHGFGPNKEVSNECKNTRNSACPS